jgi:hypothetical protein
MKSPSKMAAAVAKMEPAAKPRRERVYNAKSTPGRQGKRGITAYVSPATLEDLKAIAQERSDAEDRDILLKDVIAEALNLVLQKYGKAPTV